MTAASRADYKEYASFITLAKKRNPKASGREAHCFAMLVQKIKTHEAVVARNSEWGRGFEFGSILGLAWGAGFGVISEKQLSYILDWCHRMKKRGGA